MRLTLSKLGGKANQYGLKKFALSLLKNTNLTEKGRKIRKSVFEELNSIHPDIGSSCQAANYIDPHPSYDIQVIMPVYNTEATLRQAIESVLNQTGRIKTLLTIINDGSPDNSGEILKEYESKPGLEIITQSNKGHAGARNSGLKKISAKYVTFLDSDDFLPEDALDSLYKAAEENNSDIVQGSYTTFGEQEETTTLPDIAQGGEMSGFPWGKLFRAHLFKNLIFPEGYWFEDTLMGLVIFPLTPTAKKTSISKSVYFYRNNPTGITSLSVRSIKVLDTIWVTKKLYEDRLSMGFSSDDYGIFLRQARMNLSRVESFGDSNLTRLAFDCMREMKSHFFPTAIAEDPENKVFADSLSRGHFKSSMFLVGLLA